MIATEGSVLSVHEFNNSWIGVELLNDGFWFYSLLIVYTCLFSLSQVLCTVDFCSFTIRNYAELYHSSIKKLKIWGSYNLVFDWYSLIILRVKIVFKLFFSYNYVLHTGKLIGLTAFWSLFMCTGVCAMHILCILLRLGEQMSTSFLLHRRITYLLCIFFIPALQFSCFRFESLATYTFSIH